MAIGQDEQPTRNCTIVLHDDAISKDDILCGPNILAAGEIGYLIAANARTLCIAPKVSTKAGDEVSVHVAVARRFGFENRMNARVQLLADDDDAIATHVEVSFRDQHLSRADMWKMKAQAENQVVYQGQKLKYLETTAAEISAVFITGQEVDSAVVSHPRTRLIFRSGSARYTILVQISKEMLEHWSHGDLMFERLVSGFLPDLFGRWEAMKVHHQVTIVLFGRSHPRLQAREHNASVSAADGTPRDFYRVLVTEMSSTNWRTILRTLQKTFHSNLLLANLSLAAKGNMIDAIQCAAMDFADDNLAPPASSTGTSIIAVTAGTGLFEAEHGLLKRTTELLQGNSIGVDIVSLSSKPLHPVPVIQYELNGSVEFALPHWLDISYWRSTNDAKSPHWPIQARPQEVLDVSLPEVTQRGDLSDDQLALVVEDMSAFDNDVFGAVEDATLELTKSNETVIDTSFTGKTHLKRPSVESVKSLTGIDVADMQPALPKNNTDSQMPPGKSSTASVPLANRAKRESLPPHALMQNFRKISVGPKGLAPSLGVASTTVSAHHAQHERDLSSAISPPTENPSALARQIRDSLRKKPSLSTLAPHDESSNAEASKPIPIRANEELDHDPNDPASVIEKAVLDRESGPNSGSFSATPMGKRGSLSLPGLSSIDAQDGSNTPWLTLLNPCNPKRNNMRIASEYRKWQNVFPRAVSSGAFKWDSMCNPASLPLMTEVRVSMTDLEKHFEKKVRRILLTANTPRVDGSAQDVMHKLVALRLTAGYQIVPTRRLKKEQTAADHIEKIMMSLGGYYHELRCLSDVEVQITEYRRPGMETEVATALPATYSAIVQPALTSRSREVSITLGADPFTQDWSSLDDQCANHSAAANEQGVGQMRFALLPIQAQRSERSQLSDEERRIDGIQKLTLMWQRQRYFSEEDRQHQTSMLKPKGTKIERDLNPLAIEYQTRDPSAVVSGLGGSLDGEANGVEPHGLFTDTELFHTSNFDITKLVKHMQEQPPNGVEVKDRRWFARTHLRCFRGDELCNWLLRVFKDLETREDAVALGNQLMDRDIFTHVHGKHEFRDGHYLYQIRAAHRTTDYPDTAGLFAKGIGRSMPSTPMTEMRQSPSIRAAYADSDSSSKGTPTPTTAPVDRNQKKDIMLTQKLLYNVDPSNKSSQLEVVTLHYDRIHNPDNCYHIQLDWTTTTPKLIREAVARWSSVVDGHGLKLVQLPMKEACRLHEQHPFDLIVPIKLARQPPSKILATPQLDPHNISSPRTAADAFEYHKALLRKMDFALDLEAASSFPKGVEVNYSWGKPDFTLTQFVHKSGLLLVQIAKDDKADFLLLPNRLAPVQSANGKKSDSPSLEDIVKKFKAFCRDEAALKAFYEEMHKPKLSIVSPFARASVAADQDVPPMELPPHLGH